MENPIWYGSCAVTLLFLVLSLRAERWWPVAYVFALVFGFATGVLIWSWPEQLRDAWWLCGLVYTFALPVGRVIERRHILRRGD